MHQLGIQGLSLAIAEGSRIVHTDAMAMPGGKAHAQQTPFSIGSLTRSLTVLVVMQLVAMGEAYWVMGTLFTYLVTGVESGGSYFTLIVDVGSEAGPPPHIHHLEEEQFYVLEGQLTYSVGDQTFQVNAGDFIHIPRGTVHSFKNGPRPSRLLATFAPAGIEGFFREVGERVDDRLKSPPPVTEAAITRFVTAESNGWKDHHDTLPPPASAQRTTT
jgi:quercetin dioxygenase-like cupin family protein